MDKLLILIDSIAMNKMNNNSKTDGDTEAQFKNTNKV